MRVRWWAGIVVLVSVLITGGGATALAGRSGRVPRHRTPRGLGLAQIRAVDARHPARVIVVLRRQFLYLPADRAHIGARLAAVGYLQRAMSSKIQRDGGRLLYAYRTINAVSAVVTPAERQRLARDPDVAAVVPDVLVSEPAQQPQFPSAHGAQGRVPDSSDQAVCPSDSSHPLVEPEGLSLIKADQVTGVDGSGVKVAFLGESIDVNNPDFIRPDGHHVIFDYQDFTGEGTATPTYDNEAFGDASTIAAQGTTVHDLSTWVNPAHPLPANCDVVFRGVSPGASLAAMKVFGNTRTPLSRILQGMDWAVSVDHVDVLNESVGSNAVPDTGQNLLVQFNRQAVAAGVTVVASSGDAGPGNTFVSPGSDPSAIAVGASTELRTLKETGFAAGDLLGAGWLNNNISYFSSSGFTDNGRTLDLVAPGDTGLETCTPNSLYENCYDLNTGAPSSTYYFAGTSESAPMVAGAAALVIEAYRNSHGGVSPTPALVRQILLSTAQDLGYPSSEQGAGLVDAQAAVQAAETVDQGAGPESAAGSAQAPATAPVFLASPGQLDLDASAWRGSQGEVTVSNPSSATERISASVRSLAVPFGQDRGQVTLDPATDPTFVDDVGTTWSYRTVTFTVPAGVDLLGASQAHGGDGVLVGITLFDPSGRLANYTYDAGPADYSHTEVRDPAPGTWTAVFQTPQSGGLSGNVLYDFAFSRFATLSAVTPTWLVLPPHGRGTFAVQLPPAATPGDAGRDLVLSNGQGQQSVVPIVIRTLIPLRGGQGSFAGTVIGGDGDNGFASRETFHFSVPPGTPALSADLKLADAPGTQLYGLLVGPDGETSAQGVTTDDGSGNQVMQLHYIDPLPGRWMFEEYAVDPVGGTSIVPSFTGHVTLRAFPVTAEGVPDRPWSRIQAGDSQTASVTVTNAGPGPVNVFLDARRDTTTQYALVPLNQATNLTLPSTHGGRDFMVPGQTTTLQAVVNATAPVEFNWGFYDPSLLGTGSGDSATSTFSAREVAPTLWSISPALVGPFSGPAHATADVGMLATTRTFDPSVSSSTGDAELATVQSDAPAVTPVTIQPGRSATLTVTFAPTASDGRSVAGDLFVVDDVASAPAYNELAEIPYLFKVG
jgi:hypothetical protein